MEHTVHYKRGRIKLVTAGIATALMPLTGVGSVIAILGIKDLIFDKAALEVISNIDDIPNEDVIDD